MADTAEQRIETVFLEYCDAVWVVPLETNMLDNESTGVGVEL